VTTFDIDSPEGRVQEFVRQYELRLNSTSEIMTIWIDPEASRIRLDANDLQQVLMELEDTREKWALAQQDIAALTANQPTITTRRQAGKAAVRAIIEGRTT
jgi:hypothetical protein